MEDERDGKDHLKEGRKHLEKGSRKVLREGIEKGRKKTEYYRRNRSELISNVSRRFGSQKKPAISGIIVLLPIVIVLFVVNWLFDKISSFPGNEFFNITSNYFVNQSLKLSILLISSAILVTVVGQLVSTRTGFQLEKLTDSIFNAIPFLGSIYNITKVTTETVLGGAEDLSEPVKIEFNGFRITGFKTGNTAEDGRPIVFIPTAPNITSGLVVELDEEKIDEVDETAEQALTRVLSAGFGQSPGQEKEEDLEEEDENTEE